MLDIPSFRVEAAEQMVLLGHSGCGKSGISRPDSGVVRLDGHDVTTLSEADEPTANTLANGNPGWARNEATIC